jgi:anthranilate phosphoribosyltransferase
MNQLTFPEAVERLGRDREADRELAELAFEAILSGAWNNTQVAAFSLALNLRGLSVPLLAGAASRMRSKMVRVPAQTEGLVDTCGTGGDGSGSLNLSTGAALLLAASGVRVAKHGNRAASSQSGSADVLEALGLRLDLTAEESAQLLEEVGITFLFAQLHHPALRPLAPSRRELGVRTIWNCLGPLANPAGAEIQLLGAYGDELRPLLAGALRELGAKKAWIVRSFDGLDEVSPFVPTRVTELRNGELRELVLEPSDFGLEACSPGSTAGGTAEFNAQALRAILAGEPHPAQNAFVLNAAAALALARDLPPKDAAAEVQKVLASGAGLDKLVELTTRARELSLTRKVP